MMQHLAVTDMVTDPWFHVSLVNINAVKINFSKDQVKTADLNVNPHASKTSEPNIPRSVFFCCCCSSEPHHSPVSRS